MGEQAGGRRPRSLEPEGNDDRGSATSGLSRGARIAVTLACSECKARNYKTTKSPSQLVELKKFCKQCKKHTVHRETK